MKYSDGALGGKAGLIKHLRNLRAFLENTNKYNKPLETMVSQFNQLDKLGLLKFNKGTTNAKIEIDPKNPEVIFVLANHNPRSVGLGNILDDSEIMKLEKSAPFNLRFYYATFAGYGLHSSCMLTLAEFRKSCKWFLENTNDQQF